MKKNAAVIISLTALIILILAIYVINTEQNRKHSVDTSEGRRAIKQMETVDATEVENEIRSKNEHAKAQNTLSPEERFEQAVVAGDSISEGLYEYGILSKEQVVARMGAGLKTADTQLSQIKQLNPKTLFLSYGMNDIVSTNGDPSLFINNYRKVLKKFQSELPNAAICINSITPVKAKKIRQNKAYAKIPDYNVALKSFCRDEHITFVDNTILLKDELYEPDGVHMNYKYYPKWAAHMAEAAGI